MNAIIINGWLFEREESGWVRIGTEHGAVYFGPKEWERIVAALGLGPAERPPLAPA